MTKFIIACWNSTRSNLIITVILQFQSHAWKTTTLKSLFHQRVLEHSLDSPDEMKLEYMRLIIQLELWSSDHRSHHITYFITMISLLVFSRLDSTCQLAFIYWRSKAEHVGVVLDMLKLQVWYRHILYFTFQCLFNKENHTPFIIYHDCRSHDPSLPHLLFSFYPAILHHPYPIWRSNGSI